MTPWTRAEEKTLIELRQAKRTNRQIAAVMPGRTEEAVKNKWDSMKPYIELGDFEDHPKADIDRKRTPVGWG